MEDMRTAMDTIMCILWIVTYTFVLIGTKRYRYPLISPATQIIIAPFEFAAVYNLIINGELGFEYVSLAYLYWAFIEIAIFVVIIKSGYIKRDDVAAYAVGTFVITAVMCYFVAYRGYMLFFSYFNTFVGEVVWVCHVQKKDYPMKPFALASFITKFVADALAIIVYFGQGSWFVSLMCVMLPVLDLAFLVVYFTRKIQASRKKR